MKNTLNGNGLKREIGLFSLVQNGLTLSIFAMMTVAGLMRLRKKQPEAESP